jgi:hypothetical protein
MLMDWEIEIGSAASSGVSTEAPIIDAAWPGFVDLRKEPTRAAEFDECRAWPELIAPLIALNSTVSLLWTSKCDAWIIDNFAAEDRDEYAASDEDTHAVACYIDLLDWPDHNAAIELCRKLKVQLAAIDLTSSRVDLVVRRALLAGNREGLGITAYTAGCGPTQAQARAQLASALTALVNCSALRDESR